MREGKGPWASTSNVCSHTSESPNREPGREMDELVELLVHYSWCQQVRLGFSGAGDCLLPST